MLIYPSIFAFLLLPLHHRSTTTHSDHTWLCLHSLYQTDLAYLMDTWFTLHMYLLLFLVSPMCLLLRSNQSWAFTPHGQVLCLGWALCSLSCFSFIFNLPVFTFCSTEEPHNCLYQFPPELRFSTYASHCTASQLHCLYPTAHLEMIPCPQIAPPQSLIEYILRSPAL